MILTFCSAENFLNIILVDFMIRYTFILFFGFLFIVSSTVACRCKGYLECSLDIILFISGAFKRVLPCTR